MPMAKIKCFALAALALCANTVTPVLAARQLKQAGGTIAFPGCTFTQDSQLAQNPDFSDAYALLQLTGMNNTLSNLQSPVTVFVPTNEAIDEYLAARNETADEAASSPNLVSFQNYQTVPGAYMDGTYFDDGAVVPTQLPNNNLTFHVTSNNSSQTVVIESFGADAAIVTPAIYACNLVIYGVDGVLVPEQELVPFTDEFLQYLEVTLEPGHAEVPAELIITAVMAGQTDTVADAFDQAISMGYLQQLTAIVNAAAGLPNGVQSGAAVANNMIEMSGCDNVQRLIRQVDPANLGISSSDASSLGAQYPQLAACVQAAQL